MRIGFLGAGKMAEALLAAFLRQGAVAAGCVTACDVVYARRQLMRRRYRVSVTDDAAVLVRRCDLIVLAVKPQDLDGLLLRLAPLLGRKHLLLSIAAGKTLAHLHRLAGLQVRLVRVMPNLAVMSGEGMSVFCPGRRATAADRRLAARLLGCCGRVLQLPERHFDAVTALSGSGPAFFAWLLARLEAGAVSAGLPAEAARLLAEQTMLGTARHLMATAQAPEALIQAVSSPKGTTAAGLAVLDASDVGAVLARTIAAAAARSRELRK